MRGEFRMCNHEGTVQFIDAMISEKDGAFAQT